MSMLEHIGQTGIAQRVFGRLEGTWRGDGSGYFPTIEAFDYRETLTFERRDETTIFYEQRTEKRLRGQTAFLTSHWESGFLRALEGESLELTNAQSGGRSEVLMGAIELTDGIIRLNFVSKALTNDERMVASMRTFEIENDTLRYQMKMRTTRVAELTPHLEAVLRRDK
jgi:THAP domain-containing protein 4